jgi:phytanoyl-CoA hydroxylase
LTSDIAAIRRYYEENGYVVFEKLIDHSKIVSFISAYETLKKRKFIYYSQSVHRWIRPTFSSAGFIVESFENPSRLLTRPRFRKAVRTVLFDEKISEALHVITGADHFVSWQDMFFDRSVGTIDHFDSWYLDTSPPGSLIAAWYALEDISSSCGPFFVYARSHKLPGLFDEIKDHDQFREACLNRALKSNLKKEYALLNVGDVLFWHPMTLHGAENPASEKHSRKSFTSHFYPRGMVRRNRGDPIDLKPDLRNFMRTDNPAIEQLGTGLYNPYRFTIKGTIRYLMRDRRQVIADEDMRRRYYSDSGGNRPTG